MPRARKHHNNKGPRMIKSGAILKPLQRAAAKLGVPLKIGKPKFEGGFSQEPGYRADIDAIVEDLGETSVYFGADGKIGTGHKRRMKTGTS